MIFASQLCMGPELVEVASGNTMTVITPNPVYGINRDVQDVHDVPTEITKSIDDFAVPKRCRREGARDGSFVYSCSLCYSIAVVL